MNSSCSLHSAVSFPMQVPHCQAALFFQRLRSDVADWHNAALRDASSGPDRRHRLVWLREHAENPNNHTLYQGQRWDGKSQQAIDSPQATMREAGMQGSFNLRQGLVFEAREVCSFSALCCNSSSAFFFTARARSTLICIVGSQAVFGSEFSTHACVSRSLQCICC